MKTEAPSHALRHLKPLLLSVALLCAAAVPLANTHAAEDAAAETAQQEEEAPPPVHLDAMPVGHSGTTPWSFNPSWLLLFALAVPALTWVGFAWRRAILEDPTRMRRLGLRELQRLLAKMKRGDAVPQPQHLHAWLRASARTWGVGVSAPTASQVTQATRSLTDDATTSKWRELWVATERGLFAADTTPPKDWLDRASTAAAAVVPPRRERYFPNRLAYWIPTLAGIVLALGSFSSGSAFADAENAADPDTLADVADLAPQAEAAEKALQANWNDWSAHYNVAAYNIQHEAWSAAVAHGTAAFLLNPSSSEVRDNLRYALSQAQNVDATLRPLLFGSWYQRIPVWFSAAGWQQLAIFAALLTAVGLTALVLAIYLTPRRVLLIGGGSGFAAGLLVLVTSIASWNAYGKLHEATACILMQPVNLSPAPTDLVPTEETTPAGAGTVVHTQRAFLSWAQIAVDADHVGWVRRTAVMPLYASRS